MEHSTHEELFQETGHEDLDECAQMGFANPDVAIPLPWMKKRFQRRSSPRKRKQEQKIDQDQMEEENSSGSDCQLAVKRPRLKHPLFGSPFSDGSKSVPHSPDGELDKSHKDQLGQELFGEEAMLAGEIVVESSQNAKIDIREESRLAEEYFGDSEHSDDDDLNNEAPTASGILQPEIIDQEMTIHVPFLSYQKNCLPLKFKVNMKQAGFSKSSWPDVFRDVSHKAENLLLHISWSFF